MSNLAQQHRLAQLRAQIADIERRPVLAEAKSLVRVSEEPSPFPVLSGGLLQEVFTDERRHAGPALGFALAQVRSLLDGQRLAVLYLQMAKEGQEMGLPYGPGLAAFGFDPDALVLIRPSNIAELLWAAEEAIACRAVAAVIADIAGQPKLLDFTASRRLSLRANAAGASMIFLRYGAWREASASQLRWHLSPFLSSETPFDAHEPGKTRWRIRLEKGVIAEGQNGEWLVEWTENGFQSANENGGAGKPLAQPSLPRPVPAHLAHRLSQAG